jgi:hypothetical protein
MESGFPVFDDDSIIDSLLTAILATSDFLDASVLIRTAKIMRLMLPIIAPSKPDTCESMWNILIAGLHRNLNRGDPTRLECLRTVIEFLRIGFNGSLPDLPILLTEFPDSEEKQTLARSVGIEL